MKRTLLSQLAATFAIALVTTLPPTAIADNCNCYVGDLPSGSNVVSGDTTFVGDCQPRRYGNPDLFYNYFTKGNCNQSNAQMYISPLPVPPNVGHTFFTYQPMYPHHMLYAHKDKFHRYYDCGRGMNRTKASYYYPPVRQSASNFYWNVLRLPR